MVMNTGREKEEEIVEEVKEGTVQRTKEYEYLGFFMDEKANCMYNIKMKGVKVKGQVVALKSMASYRNVGSKFLLVRLELYESCIIKSLLYGIEAWNKQTKQEIKQLEKQQAKALCSLLEVPRSTPYLGMLNELGIWKVEERINYRRIMLVQNILKSNDRRLCKRLLLEQEEEDEDDDTLYATTRKALERYSINIKEIAKMRKSELKAKVKQRISVEMNRMVQQAAVNMTKMRFMRGDTFGRKKYLMESSGTESQKILKTRLNMQPVYQNFKGDIKLDRHCPYCIQNEDSTEHLVECQGLGRTWLNREDLKNTDNTQLWRQLNERISCNIEYRKRKSNSKY